MSKTSKRENFDVNPQQEAEIDCLQDLIKAPSRKDAILIAVRLALHLAAESRQGNQLFLGRPGEKPTRVVILGIENPNSTRWMYLVDQAHSWKKQLFVKGRKLPAAAVWTGMTVNKLTPEQAADNWDLPLDAIKEIVEYCESNQALLKMEADEEKKRLNQEGVKVEPEAARR